jgi:hypothetical protein
VSLLPCSGCGERVPGKLSTVYWAWFRADQTRYACRQRLCLACFVATVVPLAEASAQNLVACPVCHEDTISDMDPVYADIYMPNQPKHRAELALCGAHAVEIRNRAQRGCELLPDRLGGVGGPQPPNDDPNDAWAAIGLLPS